MILGIDTATDTMSVAVGNASGILGELTTNLKKNHSVRLMPAIEQLLEECGIAVADLEKIAVSSGPGSYTGLRIGVTVAKTLAWDQQIPIVGISSLAAIAGNFSFATEPVVPLIDARRGNVYGAVYQQGKSVFADQHIALEELLAHISDRAIIAGDISPVLKERISERLGDRAIFASVDLNFARASTLVKLALNEAGENATQFVPTYLKLAEAESKWLEARENK